MAAERRKENLPIRMERRINMLLSQPQSFPSPQSATDFVSADAIIKQALHEMQDRASQRDSENGERSMAKTVIAFNSLTNHSLTEGEGWLFMEVLKLARSVQGAFRLDDYVDAAAYSALRGEYESHAKRNSYPTKSSNIHEQGISNNSQFGR